MRYFLCTLFLCLFAAAESSTVFSTDFTSMPAGWLNDEWSFTGSGALVNQSVYGYQPPSSFSATMSSLSDPEVWYFVPDGTDSVLIHIEHSLTGWVDGVGSADIQLHYISGEDEYLLFENLCLGSSTSDPIDYVIQSPPPDTWIGFTVHTSLLAQSTGSGGSVNWLISEFEVTAHGDILELHQYSWGSIKNCLGK